MLNGMSDTAIELREVWSNRDDVSGYQVIYRPRKAVSSAYHDADRHWHMLYSWQPCERPWVEVDAEFYFF